MLVLPPEVVTPPAETPPLPVAPPVELLPPEPAPPELAPPELDELLPPDELPLVPLPPVPLSVPGALPELQASGAAAVRISPRICTFALIAIFMSSPWSIRDPDGISEN